tara:strand:- start:1927 stop:2325 length:399 start_codon:yes stop_codon:yes gene_type:complete
LKIFFSLLFLVIINIDAFAVEPNEKLENVVLEKRARLISSELRCLVCQNENIDSSNSEFATDLRVFVRKKLQEGLTDEEIKSYLVSKYGDFIILRPPFKDYNIILYLIGPLLFIIGVSTLFLFFVSRKKRNQ